MSAVRQEILTSATQSASGNSAAFTFSTITQAMVGVDVTAGVAITDFDLWLEFSDDGGTTWYKAPADKVTKDADGATATDQVNIVNSKSTTTAEKFLALYDRFPSDTVRVAWTLSGTSVTFSVSLVGK